MEDKALKKAAVEGDTSKLDELMRENPMLLNTVMPLFSETPLHVAALAGQAEFAKLVLQRAPNLARQTNQQGLNPLHVAAASGHANVVSVLLDFDPELALVGDFNDSKPLHYAAYHGRVEVATLLLSKKPLLLKSVNLKGETARHVAFKNKQLQVFRVLGEMLELKDDFSDQVLLRAEDGFGHSHHQFQALGNLQACNNHQMNFETLTHQLMKKKIAREAMLVIGILIATVTFQSLMNPPQSIWNDGAANEEKIKLYIFFLACNSVGFMASCVGIFSALKKDISMLDFWVSSSLIWAAAAYICVLISMVEKKVFPQVIIASLVLVIPNVIISLFVYSPKGKVAVAKIKEYANLYGCKI